MNCPDDVVIFLMDETINYYNCTAKRVLGVKESVRNIALYGFENFCMMDNAIREFMRFREGDLF